MARCTECNRFVSFEELEPEVESLDLGDGVVSAVIRIANACAECGTELTEAVLEVEEALGEAAAAHEGDGHDLEAQEDAAERVSRVEGQGRYGKMFYGAELTVTVRCGCGRYAETLTLSGYEQASFMDALV